MTILVTGANGGLGKTLIPKLRNYFNEPVIGTGRTGLITADYLPCELSDTNSVNEMVSIVKPNLILHLAGSFTGEYHRDIQSNFLNAKHLFDAALTYRLTTRIVVFGSAAEYGAVLAHQNPVSEKMECRPVSVYGFTKNCQTNLAQYYARTSSLDVVIARIFNLALKGQSQKLFYGRAEALIEAYKRKEISNIEFGNLSSARDYINEQLLFDQIISIILNGISGEVYNVGSGNAKTMRSILSDMLIAAGIPEEKVVETSSESVGRKGFDVPVIYADITKVSRLIRR